MESSASEGEGASSGSILDGGGGGRNVVSILRDLRFDAAVFCRLAGGGAISRPNTSRLDDDWCDVRDSAGSMAMIFSFGSPDADVPAAPEELTLEEEFAGEWRTVSGGRFEGGDEPNDAGGTRNGSIE